jgi:hypothetical protein
MNDDLLNSNFPMASLTPEIAAVPSARGGLDLVMPDLAEGAAPTVSDVWTFGKGWTFQFLSVPPNGQIRLDHSTGKVHLKVITGSLPSIPMPLFAQPQAVRSTYVPADVVQTGEEGARVAVIVELPGAPHTIQLMEELTVSGAEAERLY